MADPDDRDASGASPLALLLAAFWILIVGVAMASHELWRDEWQAWLLARDSESVVALLRNLRYEGHPPTWHLLLFPLSRLTRSVVAMQALHLALAAAAMWLLVRYAPWTRLQKALAVFGYFTAYEYAVISRHYVLGMLALFGACAAWRLRRSTYLPLAAWLALLALSSVYGVILTLAFGCAILAEWIADPDLRNSLRTRKGSTLTAALIVVGAVGMSVVSLRPSDPEAFGGSAATVQTPAAQTPTAQTPTVLHAARVVAQVPVRALAPLPRLRDGAPVWGQTALLDAPGVPNAPLVGLALIAGIALLALRRTAAFALLAAGTAGLLSFAWAIHYGGLRHQGSLMLLVLASAWLARTPGHAPPLPQHLLDRATRIGGHTFTALLLVQTVAFAAFWVADLRLPFSEGEGAARRLAEVAGDSIPIVTTNGAWGTTLAGHLDQPVRFMDQDTTGTFIRWGLGRRRVPVDSVLPRVTRLLHGSAGGLLLVTQEPLPDGLAPAGIRMQALADEQRPQLAPEYYTLYLITRDSTKR